MEGDLLVDLLIERHPPQPGTEGSLHFAKRILETLAEKRCQVSISAASCLRPLVGEAVQLRPAAELRCTPLRLNPAAPLHAIEGRVERAFLDHHRFVRALFDEAGNRVAVSRTRRQRLENQGVERAMQERVGQFGRRRHGPYITKIFLVMGR